MTRYLPVFTSPQGEAEVLRAYDVVLRHWSVPYTEFDVATSFGQTHVIASGAEEAPPVILLHALFATATSWYRTVGPLSRHHRTFAVDVIGEANKSRPTRPVLSLDDYKIWFTELADGLGVSKMSLVGNSMGGFGAAYLAMYLPERIRKLVLIDPAATFHSIVPFYLHMFIPKALYLFFPWLPGCNTVMRRSVDWAFAGLPSDGPWEELFKLSMVHGSTQSRVFPRVYTAQELARIEVPTLLILGDREKIYRASDAKRAALRLMPSVQVQIIPGAHHIAAIAQPDAVNESLLDFLD
jgi:pimeloyl-ACP methyl ester carboxylesterase